jgi:hypothetical protein
MIFELITDVFQELNATASRINSIERKSRVSVTNSVITDKERSPGDKKSPAYTWVKSKEGKLR